MKNYKNLSIEELLQIVLREKRGEYLVKELTSNFKSLQELLIDADENELLHIKGVGCKRIQQLKAISELARRLYGKSFTHNLFKISQPKDAADLLMTDMMYLKQEALKVILLNTKNVVLDVITTSLGSLNSSIVHPRETFAPAIRKGAASIIVVHNHPSGDPSPSSEDINITHRLKECGKLLGIDLLDHVIIGNGCFTSLKEKGIL